MMNLKIQERISGYDSKNIRIGVLGSHSALEIASGAKQESFETVVVCQKGRDKTYTKYYKKLFDHIILLDNFADITKQENVEKLANLNTIFVPNRSFSVYAGYEAIEKKFTIPLLGNRYLLRTEEEIRPEISNTFFKNQEFLFPKYSIHLKRLIAL